MICQIISWVFYCINKKRYLVFNITYHIVSNILYDNNSKEMQEIVHNLIIYLSKLLQYTRISFNLKIITTLLEICVFATIFIMR